MEDYVARALAGKAMSDRPFYCLSIGGPGAGKGTPNNYLGEDGDANYALVDMAIMDGFPAYEKNRAHYVHPEKVPETIAEFYRRTTEIVYEAVRRGISIVLEDHGDFPDVYRHHIELASAGDYETFLTRNTITVENLHQLLIRRQTENGFPVMLDAAAGYHRRVFDLTPELQRMFSRGVLFEKASGPLPGSKYTRTLAKHCHEDGQVREDIIHPEGYRDYLRWGEWDIHPEVQERFDQVDAALAREFHCLRFVGRHADGARSHGYWNDFVQNGCAEGRSLNK